MPSAPDPALVSIFEAEVAEIVDTVHDHLMQIEQGAADKGSRLEDVLRLAHDLKGSARVVGYDLVARLAHALEAHLLVWRKRAPSAAESSLAFRASDTLRELALDVDDAALQARARELCAALSAPVPPTAAKAPPAPAPATAAPATPAPPPSPAAARTEEPAAPGALPAPPEVLRIARARVDAVADDVAVMLMKVFGAQARVADLRGALDTLRALAPPRRGASERELARAFSKLQTLCADIGAKCVATVEMLNQFDHHARQLDENARQLRIVPARRLLAHLGHVARDAAQALGRQVHVELEGVDQQLDVALLEALKGPLTHAVRNAVDHGIEPPGERQAAGKPPAGTLRLHVSEQGDRLRVSVSDDGRGIDRQAVRRRLGAGAEGLDDTRLLAALLRSGLSTRDEVTEISGRGLGLGAIAAVADRLRGDVQLLSEPGAGTQLLVSVPLRLSTLSGVVVMAAGNHYVLPVSELAEVGRGAPQDSTPLAAILGLPDAGRPAQVVHLLARERPMAQGPVALGVDRILDRLEVVRRPTGSHLGRVPFVDGATVLPHGEPALILDARELADACAGAPGAAGAGPAPRVRRRVLLVDDCNTLRAKVRHDLAQAGLEVELAEDGQAALERLEREDFDAVVSDVQMPRLDGLQLLERCGSWLPVVLMTAFPEPRGEARARQFGAAAYLPKDDRLGDRILSVLNRFLSRNPERLP